MRNGLHRAAAFTLIELLVVVTIIVVLLALLVPAMDKAITAAALAVCQASNLRSIASVAVQYAGDNKRTYPNNRPENYYWDALFLRNKDFNFDLRSLYRPYCPTPELKIFADPLSGNINFEDDANLQGIDIYSNYRLYGGWGIAGTKPAKDDYVGQTQAALAGWNGWKKMKKMGDAFTFTETRGGVSIPVKFKILASDVDGTGYWGYWRYSSHPDWTGKFSFKRWQNEIPTSQQNAFTPVTGGRTVTQSWWDGDGQGTVGVTSFAYDDGSVLRVDDVKHDDPRMAKIVETSLQEYKDIDRYAQLPKAH